MPRNEYLFETGQELCQSLANSIADDLRSALASRGAASLALSGGRTPLPLFQALSQIDLDWSKVWITLVDDRWVPLEHKDSNEALLRANLLQNKAQAAHFVGLYNGAATPMEGLEQALQAVAAIPQPFDVMVLGMGDDGHTASWFPESPQLAQAVALDAPALAATDPITAPHLRMTFTLPVVQSAKRLVLHTVGDGKWQVYQNALAGQNPAEMPIRYALQQQGAPVDVYWSK